jgi:periplasmic mercuric ion binding protein
MKTIFILLSTLFLNFGLQAQKTQEVQIQTSAECGDCKQRIEDKLNYVGGIRFAELDVPSKVLTVKFQQAKISLTEIKKIISEIGYDADEIKAIPEAVQALPKCCQPGGMGQ